jgi:hypothetical protein
MGFILLGVTEPKDLAAAVIGLIVLLAVALRERLAR